MADRAATGERSLPRVRVEFYGLARLRAKRGELVVHAATLSDALRAADAECDDLRVVADGRIERGYLVCLNGDRFTTDTTQALAGGDTVAVFGADAGG